MPLRKLPKSFIDAFDTARKFGLRYIWIDSLCIIQDDRQDWARESLTMCDVYGLSALNIAATGAEDGSKGLFFSRSPSAVQKFQTTIRPGSNTASPVRVEWGLGRANHYCVLFTALARRGWVFQERFLAPRTLHFGKEQIFWDCLELQACETYPEGLSPLNYKTGSNTQRDISIRRNFPSRDVAWANIVEDYTSRELTRVEDQLVAISGVAKWVHTKYGGTYLCGFWKEDLPHSLLWANDWENRVPNVYLAPSWSWASRIDDIRFPRPRDNPDRLLVSIIDVQVQNRGESIYGPVISGFIRLKCCSLVPCDEDIIQKEWIWHYLDNKGKYLAHYLPPNCYYLSFYDSVKDHQSNRLIIRPFDGLIIQPTGRARGQFRRLGIYLPGEEGSVWLQQAREFVSSENLLLYEGLVMGEEEDLRYIISLI